MLYGSYAGALVDATEEELELDAAFEALIKVGWERPTPEFRRVFTYHDDPRRHRGADALARRPAADGGRRRDRGRLARQQRKLADASTGCSPSSTCRPWCCTAASDQMNRLPARRATSPRSIRGARLVALESDNHIVLADEPAWPVFLREVDGVPGRGPGDRPPTARSADVAVDCCRPGSCDVLGLAAEGCDNDAIAAELVLSVRTVERHLQNVYAKLGLTGTNARTAAVARLLARRCADRYAYAATGGLRAAVVLARRHRCRRPRPEFLRSWTHQPTRGGPP